jgi:hypothetical protein
MAQTIRFGMLLAYWGSFPQQKLKHQKIKKDDYMVHQKQTKSCTHQLTSLLHCCVSIDHLLLQGNEAFTRKKRGGRGEQLLPLIIVRQIRELRKKHKS